MPDLNTGGNTVWNVVLADDHAILLDGLANLVGRQEGLNVVGTASNGRQALELVLAGHVDLLITDHSMPDMNGHALVTEVSRKRPDVAVIVLTMHEELHLYNEMTNAGARGYVLKKDSHSELIAAIAAIRSGDVYVSPVLASAIRIAERHPDQGRLLSRREKEILGLIVAEHTNREIAEKLFISELTVETHRKNIFRKTGANSLVGLINFAHANGLIE